MVAQSKNLTADEISRVIEMAWEDRTPFEAIEASFGLNESQVIELMRREMKSSSFKMWGVRKENQASSPAWLFIRPPCLPNSA